MSKSRLTQTRYRVVAALQKALDVPVYSAPPSKPAAPCVWPEDNGTDPLSIGGTYSRSFRVVVAGPGGDNDAAMEGLELLVEAALMALHGTFRNRPGYSHPVVDPFDSVTLGGTSVLVARITLTVPVEEDAT